MHCAAVDTRQTIEVFRDHGLGLCTLTKGCRCALCDIDLFRPNHDSFASTLTSLDDGFSRRWERNAALPGDRFKALQAFHGHGIFTWVSLEPTLDAESSLAIVEATYPFVDLFKIGRVNYSSVTRSIDWGSYTERMVELCSRLNVRHYVKQDLAGYLVGHDIGSEAGNSSLFFLCAFPLFGPRLFPAQQYFTLATGPHACLSSLGAIGKVEDRLYRQGQFTFSGPAQQLADQTALVFDRHLLANPASPETFDHGLLRNQVTGRD